jgi:methylthioribose-1-phosphate isomerase
MKIDGIPYRTIWLADDASVAIIDQTRLPHEFVVAHITSVAEAVQAIKTMQVRGAPLIGAMAAYGLALAMRANASDAALDAAIAVLAASRPTAVNLAWALKVMDGALRPLTPEQRADAAFARAVQLCDEDGATNRRIGEQGVAIIRQHAQRKAGGVVNILTHCNAGWLATVDWGTALAPIYLAHDEGLPVHVWVDETRPRNQGAALSAYELGAHGVPHTVIVDNAGGHLMQHGRVDLCIVGADRVTANGDAANKIGTYLKALAAHDNDVPFYVAVPHSTIDWQLSDGRAIPIEERDAREVTHLTGRSETGEIATVQVTAPGSAAANPAFDVTPARLLTGLITERGVCAASTDALAALFPESVRPE